MHEADREFPPPELRTLTVHAGADRTPPVRPLTPPLDLSTVYAFHDSPLADARFAADEPIYARDGLPTVRRLERAVAALEGAEDAHAVASGMAAISLTMLALLAAGDHVVVARDGYRDTEALLTQQLARFGVVLSAVDLDEPCSLAEAVGPATRLVCVETISNPGLALRDLPGLAAVTRKAGTLLCIDNTFATPVLCRPLDHGADLVLHSASKFLGGHHDLTAGVVCGRRDVIERIRRSGYLFGPTLGPFDAWLALRGLKTLAPRIAWASATAARVADFLAAHPAVAAVRYPGRPAPGRAELTRRLLPHGAGAMLAFAPRGGPPAADAVIRAFRLIAYAPSLGGTETIASYPPQPEASPDGGRPAPQTYRNAWIRLSIGLEAAADVIADLDQALWAADRSAGRSRMSPLPNPSPDREGGAPGAPPIPTSANASAVVPGDGRERKPLPRGRAGYRVPSGCGGGGGGGPLRDEARP